jgi:hypothetical protein
MNDVRVITNSNDAEVTQIHARLDFEDRLRPFTLPADVAEKWWPLTEGVGCCRRGEQK